MTTGTQTEAARQPGPPALLDSQRFRNAVTEGDVRAVTGYLDRDPALMYSRDEKGRSVFMLACLMGRHEVADLFVARGLALDLFEAAMGGHIEQAQALIKEDPRLIDLQALSGSTPVHLAAQCGQVKMVEALVNWGADFSLRDKVTDTTPLLAAAYYPDLAASEPMADKMLTNGADPNAKQHQNFTPLHAAAANGSVYLTTLLIRKGAQVDVKDDAGKTPLDLANAKRHLQVADLLRNNGRIPCDHSTSRFVATEQGQHLEMAVSDLPQDWINEFVRVSHFDFERVKALLARHPELLHTRATWDERAIEASAHMGRKDMVRFLLDKGAAFSLCTATVMGMTDRVKVFLQEDPHRIYERGPHDFPLMWYPAIGKTSVDVAETLIAAGCDVNSNLHGRTALHMAVEQGMADLVKLLLSKGADINARAKTESGEVTPLALATKKGQKDIGGLLRAQGGKE